MSMPMKSTEEEAASSSPLPPYISLVPQAQETNIRTLATDLFDWLATAWQLPVTHPEHEQKPLPPSLLLTEDVYALEDLMRLYEVSEKVETVVQRYHLVPMGYRPNGKRLLPLYRREDLGSLVQAWEWKRLDQILKSWWLRFLPDACSRCHACKKHPHNRRTQQFVCKRIPLNELRSVVTHFLREVVRLGSVGAWWREHSAESWEGKRCANWGVLFLYLLDRRLLHVSTDELLQLTPLCTMRTEELIRLWRARRPQEYQQFGEALQLISSEKGMRRQVFFLLCVLILLRYGFAGLAELSLLLSAEDLQQRCREGRLVTLHLGHGIFFPSPLSADICVGHALLDDLRFFCWDYAAKEAQRLGTSQWNRGPHCLEVYAVNSLERALAAPMYAGSMGILPRRPEIDRSLVNPWRIHALGVSTQNGYVVQPPVVQQQVMTYLMCCHQEQGLALETLHGRAEMLMHFFSWVRAQGKLEGYPHWEQAYAHEVFRAYVSNACSKMKESSRIAQVRFLHLFFVTLAELGFPVPAGYPLLSLLGGEHKWQPRSVPREEIVDRVFRDGVCQLSYDPFARLALTIQYYCGTRVTETCDLHVFCVLEDQQGHAYLLIPRGKTKKERPFPIVEVGMTTLLTYMDEIIALRLSADGTSRLLGRTNFRYVQDDPERAKDWHYLFDRVPVAHGLRRGRGRGRLSVSRVNQALQEALLIAAKHNAEGLFQPETYHAHCQSQWKKGQRCGYFVAQEGITTCPCCGSRLSGKRGTVCSHRFEEEARCKGVAQAGAVFCPACDQPLAQFVPITSHVFRHNSVSRAYHSGVPVLRNMQLHGHSTIPMYLRYLHLLLENATEDVRHIFAEKRLEDVRLELEEISAYRIGQENVVPLSLELYLCLTLQRSLKRRTCGIWGGFWAGALAQRGVASPLSADGEVILPQETYEHAVAQYWYEALGLAVLEVAFEVVTAGEWHAQVPAFLERQKIEELVQYHLCVVQESLGSVLGMKLIETDIMERRQFLRDLAENLHPWWQHLGAIDRLVEIFAPGGGQPFQKRSSTTQIICAEID